MGLHIGHPLGVFAVFSYYYSLGSLMIPDQYWLKKRDWILIADREITIAIMS
jgi:hypothetical protein